MAAAGADGVDRRGLVDRGAVRAADCARAAATLDYVTVTVIGVTSMTNPFVYGEIVPAAAFVDREVELDRLGRDSVRRAEGLPHLSPPLRQVLARAAGLEERGQERRAHRRSQVSSYSSYVAFLEGYARALAVGRDAAGSRSVMAERNAVRRPAGGADRA